MSLGSRWKEIESRGKKRKNLKREMGLQKLRNKRLGNYKRKVRFSRIRYNNHNFRIPVKKEPRIIILYER